MKRVQTQQLANFVRGIERIGGFGGKSDILARGQVHTGSPEHYKTSLENIRRASTNDLKLAAQKWLSSGVLEIEVRPFANLKPSGPGVDRKKMPDPGPISDAKFPTLERAALSNGLKIILAERHQVPIVNLALAVDAGYASDQFGSPGTAKLAMAMLDEGTKTRSSLQIGDEALEGLGARLTTGSNLDTSRVTLSALKANLDPSLAIFADVILNPSFPQSDFQREQKLLIAAIQREKVQPMTMGLRLLPSLIYGKAHAYANPLTGSGTERSAGSIDRSALVKFHQTWFRPNNATLVVVGDTTMAEIKPKLERAFQSWTKGEVPQKILQVEHREKPIVYVLDRPDPCSPSSSPLILLRLEPIPMRSRSRR